MELSDLKDLHTRQNLRLETLTRIRWLAIAGQFSAIIIVWLLPGFDFAPIPCLLLIAASAILNVGLGLKYPTNQRLSSNASTALLAYDILQLGALLFLTGGLQNPFAVLLMVPVVISATTLSILHTMFLGGLVMTVASLLVFFHLPLPWLEGETLELPRVYITGMWVAIISSLSFTAIYAFRVADEARKLGDALTATELVLQREQHLSNLDGLAAAAAHELGTPLATIALVSKEMSRELDESSPLVDDAKLLRSQAERCREILKTLTSLSGEGDRHIGQMPFPAIMEEVADPHRNFGVDVVISYPKDGDEPNCIRNPGILYGLGNLIENAVDYAKSKVSLEAGWDENNIWVNVKDDGKGYGIELLDRIGEPFVTSRSKNAKSGGLGLGLFIAKTLLERSGGSVSFSNASNPEFPGASIKVIWPRASLES